MYSRNYIKTIHYKREIQVVITSTKGKFVSFFNLTEMNDDVLDTFIAKLDHYYDTKDTIPLYLYMNEYTKFYYTLNMIAITGLDVTTESRNYKKVTIKLRND